MKSSPDFREYFTSTVLTMEATAALDTLVLFVYQKFDWVVIQKTKCK
jgi:hypothetical protein